MGILWNCSLYSYHECFGVSGLLVPIFRPGQRKSQVHIHVRVLRVLSTYSSTRVRTRVRTHDKPTVALGFARLLLHKIGALEARAGDAHGCAVDVMASDATSDARGQHGGARPPRSSRRGPDKAKQRQLPALVFRLVPSTWVFRWFLVQCQPTSLVAPRMRGSGP
jgi:hypothetical protein